MINAHAEGQNFTYHDFNLTLKLTLQVLKKVSFTNVCLKSHVCDNIYSKGEGQTSKTNQKVTSWLILITVC